MYDCNKLLYNASSIGAAALIVWFSQLHPKCESTAVAQAAVLNLMLFQQNNRNIAVLNLLNVTPRRERIRRSDAHGRHIQLPLVLTDCDQSMLCLKFCVAADTVVSTNKATVLTKYQNSKKILTALT
jgi:hypothetical protein